MSRRNSNVVYRIKKDLIYHNEDIEKFINIMMRDGKKTLSRKFVYFALNYIHNEIKKELTAEEQNAKNVETLVCEIFAKIIENVGPLYEVIRRRIGGATYSVPTSVKPKRSKRLGMDFIKKSVHKSEKNSIYDSLCFELLEAYHSRGGAIAMKEMGKKTVDSNMVYAHYNNRR